MGARGGVRLALRAVSTFHAVAAAAVSVTVADSVENPLYGAIVPGLFAGRLGRENLGLALGLEGPLSLLPWLLAAGATGAGLAAAARARPPIPAAAPPAR